MIYGSVCSGIEAATVAWHPLGWRPAFFSEIEAFPRAVLTHHYPNIPLHGDFTTIESGQYEPIDLLVGGTPCQDFSIAGLRAGIAGDRGNLTLEFVRLLDRLRPQWMVWENVPGVLSSDGGRAFGAFLGGLGQLGYGFAYRVLDAQYFGLAQRRQRVFVVGYLGDWRPAAAVLFERESLSGNPAPRRKAGEGVAPILEVGARTNGDGDRDGDGIGNPGDPMFTLQASKVHGLAFGGNNTHGPIDIATALSSHGGPHGRQDFESETFIAHALRAEGFDASEDGTGRGTPLVPVAFSSKDHGADAGEIALRAMGHSGSHANAGGQVAIAYSIMPQNSGKDYKARQVDVAQPLMAGGPVGGNQGGDYIRQHTGVRRLTPRECERLQGFPDDYTAILRDGKLAADGPRYKALGNSMAVPCMRWIGERIELIHRLINE